ncbi:MULTISPECIES: hypothetical protein [Nocardia]|uniref:hypothetical protein n=1 Tax=Nocardia TaxID=1817 RepID=UPI0007A4C263|nr:MULTISPECIES: hypothetical protein [Nocardia]
MTTSDPIVLVVEHRDAADLDADANELFGKNLDDNQLTYLEAMALVSAFLHTRLRNAASTRSVTRDGTVVASSDDDGLMAARGVAEGLIRDMETRADEDTALHITIAPTVWQRLTGRRGRTLRWHPAS